MTSHPLDRVALTVVIFLGMGMLGSLAGVIYLVHQATASANQIDPSTVALVSGVSTLAGAAFGSLGSILASTGKGAPQPVTVENPTSDPVPVERGDAGHADLALILLVATLIGVALLLFGVQINR